MTAITLDRSPAMTMQCQPWCAYQDCWKDPAASPIDGTACISAEREVTLDGAQPWLPKSAYSSMSLYLGPDTTEQRAKPAVLLAFAEDQMIQLTPTRARELANALTALAALVDSSASL